VPEYVSTNSRESNAGARASLVQSFTIMGLYGYRTISLSSKYAATILIAENGSGKTTVIGALDAFLKGQFSRLKDLDFSEIRCNLNTIKDELALSRTDIIDFLDVHPESEIGSFARRIDIDPLVLFKFIAETYPWSRGDYRALSKNDVFSSIERISNYKYADAVATCERLTSSLTGKNARIETVRSALDKALRDVEIVYLPTYRRIELPLSPTIKDSRLPRRRGPNFKFPPDGLFVADMQFGLGDISERLAELNQTILIESNF
jgi:hypothetical protein